MNFIITEYPNNDALKALNAINLPTLGIYYWNVLF